MRWGPISFIERKAGRGGDEGIREIACQREIEMKTGVEPNLSEGCDLRTCLPHLGKRQDVPDVAERIDVSSSNEFTGSMCGVCISLCHLRETKRRPQIPYSSSAQIEHFPGRDVHDFFALALAVRCADKNIRGPVGRALRHTMLSLGQS